MKAKILNWLMPLSCLIAIYYIGVASFTDDYNLPYVDQLLPMSIMHYTFFQNVFAFSLYGCIAVLTVVMTFCLVAKIIGLEVNVFNYGKRLQLSSIHFSNNYEHSGDSIEKCTSNNSINSL